nr:MAG TPA: major capsid protein [Caudoviricetes sp.]
MSTRWPLGNEINTIIQTTDTELDSGTAVQLVNSLIPVLSKEILFMAEPVYTFYEFAARKTELTTNPGNEIKMLTYNNLKLSEPLKEGKHIKTQTLSSSTKSIKVVEHGTAVMITEAAIRFSFVDELEVAMRQLSRNYVQTIEKELCSVAVKGGTGTSKLFGREKGAAKIGAIGEIEAGKNDFSVTTVKDAVEVLTTNNVPKINGYYVCILHPHQARTLRDDPAWINASNYGAPEQLFNGEIGRIDDVRFVVTTMMPNGAAAESELGYDATLKQKGKNQEDVYAAIIFGEDYYCIAENLAPEIRTDATEDFGREMKIAWYGIWGTDVLNPTHGVVIQTA